jgi:hypothetical protein
MKHGLLASLVVCVSLIGPSIGAAAPPKSGAQPAACTPGNLLAGKKPMTSSDIKGDVGLITDGAIAPEGAVWDAPVAVTFDVQTGSVVYDLGSTQTVAAIFVQADANDTYRISGGVENTAASFTMLGEIPNVVDRGHGLRTRTIDIQPTPVRYLRFGDGNGDGFFSISELAAYCQKPTPFPPAMRVTDVPAAPAADGKSSTPQPSDGGRSALILTAAALGLAWLAYRTVKRASSRSAANAAEAASAAEGGESKSGAEAPSSAAEPSASDTDVKTDPKP